MQSKFSILLTRVFEQIQIISVHVRRTDKSKEATFIDIEHYLSEIQDYYDILIAEGHPEITRKLLLTTDDPSVLEEVLNNYKQDFDEILYNKSSILLGNHEKKRYSLDGQWSIAKDVIYLSLADFMVCTFSSNICRVAYALRCATKPIHKHLYEVVSLDSDWFILQEYQVVPRIKISQI